MSVWSAENELKRARAALEDARRRQAAEEKKASDADKTAANRMQSARRTPSPSSVQSYLREADRKSRDAQTARAKAADYSAKAAAAQTKVHQAETRLARAQADEEKKREAERRRQQQAADRAARQAEVARHNADAARDQQIAALEAELAEAQAQLDSRPWEDAPKRITVLFLASEPDRSEHLYVDREVREIQDRVRSSKLRDSIAFEYRPAARVTDLLQHLNEVEPDIVHFSGHGADSGLALHDAQDQVRLLSNTDLEALLQAAPNRPKLAVFNSCNSAEQARVATRHIDAAIGMETSIEDESARIFAGQLYNSLGFGRPLSLAFEQARLQVQLTFDAVSGDPTLHTAEDLDPSEIVLVAPDPTG